MSALDHLRSPEGVRFLRFCAVGSSGVLVNMAVFLAAHAVLKDGRETLLANNIAVTAGFSVSCFCNFLLNDNWTWRDRREQNGRGFGARMLSYFLVAIIAYLVQLLTFNGVFLGLALPAWIANLVGIAAATVVNFGVNNRWTFGARS